MKDPKVQIQEISAFGLLHLIFSNLMHVPHFDKTSDSVGEKRILETSVDLLETIKQQ